MPTIFSKTRKPIFHFFNDGHSFVFGIMSVRNASTIAAIIATEINNGDFIVRTKDLQTFGKNYFFTARYLYTSIPVKTMQLKQPKIAVTGSAQLKFVVSELGFETVKQADADVIVSDSSIVVSNLPGKTFVGLG